MYVTQKKPIQFRGELTLTLQGSWHPCYPDHLLSLLPSSDSNRSSVQTIPSVKTPW